MEDSAFFMAMGGLGVSLAGFAGLLSAFGTGHSSAPAVYRWRINEIVISSIQLSFIGFGVVVALDLFDQPGVAARLGSAAGAVAMVHAGVAMARSGDAWPDDRARRTARYGILGLWVPFYLANVIVGDLALLQAILLLFLYRPTSTFIRAVRDVAHATSEGESPN